MKSNQLTVAAAQMKFRAAIEENVSWINQAIQSAANAGADVVLFPECAVTGYNCDFTRVSPSQVEAALHAIASTARSAGCYVLVGCPTFNGRKRFNSLAVFDRHGRKVFC